MSETAILFIVLCIFYFLLFLAFYIQGVLEINMRYKGLKMIEKLQDKTKEEEEN